MTKTTTRLKKLQREGNISRVTSSHFSFTEQIKKELVEPSLHRFDYSRLINECETNRRNSDEYRRDPMASVVPQHYIHDVQSMYLNEGSNLKFQNGLTLNKGKKVKFDVLTSVYNSLYKGFTENNPVYSKVMTMEIAKYLNYHVFSKLTEEEQEQLEDSQDGESEGDLSGIQQKLQDAIQGSKDDLEQSMEIANETIKDLKDLGVNGKEAGSGDIDSSVDINQLKKILSRVKSGSNGRLKKLFKVLLDNSKNYFTSKKKYHDESIFDADELDEIEGLEYLNPSFKKAHLMDVVAKTSTSMGKVDLYIDCSGSMGNSLLEAKVIALKLLNMNYVHEVYYFNQYVHKPKQDFTSILKFDRGGGTNFTEVIRSVKENNRNAVVLTDGCDRCREYSEKAFFVGIDGANFGYFGNNDESKKFLNNKQCIKFENSGKYTYDRGSSQSEW